MIFTELVLQNFGPYLGRQTINLSPESGSIILFGGMNGGGKTTLVDGIRLALYGHRAQCSTRGALPYSSFLGECINRHAVPGEKTRIELALQVVVDGGITIVRAIRYWAAGDEKDTLEVLVDDWPDKAIAKTWDEYLENLFPLGISTLFLFDGEQVKELAELDTPPPILVSAIKSLLGLELAERLSADLDIFASRKRKELANTSELAELEEIESTLKTQGHARDVVAQDLASIDGQMKAAEIRQQQALDKFVTQGGRIAGDRVRLESEQSKLTQEVDDTRQDLRELAAGALPLMLIAPLLQQAQAQIQAEVPLAQSRAARAIIEERDLLLLDYLAELSLAQVQLNKVQSFLKEQSCFAEGEEWLHSSEEATLRLNTILGYELNFFVDKARADIEQLEKLKEDINFLDRELATAASPELYQDLEGVVKATQKAAAQLIAQRELKQQQYNQVERQLKATKNQLEAFTDEHLKVEQTKHNLDAIARAKSTLALFKEKITLRKINKLEIEVTECFRYLLRKTDLVHRIAIDVETFGMSLYDQTGTFVPKHRLSAGEKQLLAIAFLWGLARLSGRKIPVAIDTPLGRLDSSHRTNLLERYFPVASDQVILLSTDTEIGEKERQQLRDMDAISREYLLKYDPVERFTSAIPGYFFV
jgi:DNA sulfur modification protein DndD